MAQDAPPQFPVSVPSAGANLTRERVRAALLHMAELACAYEGTGFEMIEVEAGSTPDTAKCDDPDAMACMVEVVERLERHRNEQGARLRTSVAVRFLPKLTEHYQAFKRNGDPRALADEVGMLFKEFGLQAREQDVKGFVIRPHHLKRDGESMGGPAEAAVQVVANKIEIGVSRSTIYNFIRQGAGAWFRRTSWRRWIPIRLARRYVGELFEAALAARDTEEAPTLEDVVELRPPLFALVERRTEQELRAWMISSVQAIFERVLSDDERPVPSGVAERDAWEQTLEELREERRSLADNIRDRPDAEAQLDALMRDLRAVIDKYIDRELRTYGLA